jgi:WD40-like Beta Propeller Repeat
VRARLPTTALALVASGAVALSAGAATAAAPSLQLVSASALEQADVAVQPALSADGRSVAFGGSLDGISGVFRRDLATGALDLVAGGSAYDPGAPGADAHAPSISADGRWVSFTTRTPLDPADDVAPDTSDVYVRDMDAPPPPGGGACTSGSPCPYELASALDGSARGLTYADGGASAAGRVALSADGRSVAFTTSGASDLTSGPGGSTPGVQTPGGQVVVRDLATHRTTLVSTVRDPQTGAMTALPVPDGALMSGGAALSGDGSTVAWLGAHLPAQVPLLAGEAQTIEGDDDLDGGHYDEPLWRRIADGPSAPTRRMAGGGDPLAPGCPPDGTLADPACQGPFPQIASNRFQRDNATGWLGAGGDGTPHLSADGRAAVVIGDPTGPSNVFLVDMRDGLSRRQAVRPITREVPLDDPSEAGQFGSIVPAGDVFDAGISPDGRRLAFATARQQFPLAPPNVVGPPPAQLGLVELYRVDLDRETLERVTQGPGGAPSLGSGPLFARDGAGASAPSFSADDHVLAFASQASDLLPGDANGASDVFVAADPVEPDVPGVVAISPAPAPAPPRPRWTLATSAASLADGGVRLDAVVPGAGTLRVRTRATIVVRAAPARGRKRARARLATRTVATAARRVHGSGTLRLTLRLARRYRALARSRIGLDATIAVAFSGHGGRTLHDALDVTFRVRRARRATPRRAGAQPPRRTAARAGSRR